MVNGLKVTRCAMDGLDIKSNLPHHVHIAAEFSNLIDSYTLHGATIQNVGMRVQATSVFLSPRRHERAHVTKQVVPQGRRIAIRPAWPSPGCASPDL